MTDAASDGISLNRCSSSIESLVKDLLFKTRYLRRDLQTVERAAQPMEEVSLLDKTLRVFTEVMQGAALDCDDVIDQRRRDEAMVRIGIQ